MILRARVILPVDRPPVDDGAVFLSGGTVAAVGRWSDIRTEASGEAVDLGEVVLMPGLVNAHCHLEYTHLAGCVANEGGFTRWLRNIIRAKCEPGSETGLLVWGAGLEQAVRSGTTTLCDIVSNTALPPRLEAGGRIRVTAFLEMTGVISGRPDFEVLESALAGVAGLVDSSIVAGLSPHALYSTSGGLRRLVATDGRSARLPKTIHLAESRDEWSMFLERKGPMFDWLEPLCDLSGCSGRTPVEVLEPSGLLGPECSVVHANYVSDADVEKLARQRVSVIHCPRSHAFFGHDPFPCDRLSEAGVNVCLGTDSLASTAPEDGRLPILSMFHEMAAFADAHPNVAHAEVLKMATSNAGALPGVERSAGRIEEGSNADLIAIPFSDSIDKVEESVIRHRDGVVASMVGGRWVVQPEHPEGVGM